MKFFSFRMILLVGSVFLSGCALTPERAAKLSDYELCGVATAPLAPASRKMGL